eukprot:6181556-Pleurochrysis_carterae.AAC.2
MRTSVSARPDLRVSTRMRSARPSPVVSPSTPAMAVSGSPSPSVSSTYNATHEEARKSEAGLTRPIGLREATE